MAAALIPAGYVPIARTDADWAFDITFHFPSTHYPVLFLKINMEGALGNKTGGPASRSVKIHTALARASSPA